MVQEAYRSRRWVRGGLLGTMPSGAIPIVRHGYLGIKPARASSGHCADPNRSIVHMCIAISIQDGHPIGIVDFGEKLKEHEDLPYAALDLGGCTIDLVL